MANKSIWVPGGLSIFVCLGFAYLAKGYWKTETPPVFDKPATLWVLLFAALALIWQLASYFQSWNQGRHARENLQQQLESEQKTNDALNRIASSKEYVTEVLRSEIRPAFAPVDIFSVVHDGITYKQKRDQGTFKLHNKGGVATKVSLQLINLKEEVQIVFPEEGNDCLENQILKITLISNNTQIDRIGPIQMSMTYQDQAQTSLAITIECSQIGAEPTVRSTEP